MKPFREHLTESISIKKIEDQLRTQFEKESIADVFDFKEAISKIIRNVGKELLQNTLIDFVVVEIIDKNTTVKNSGSFMFVPKNIRVRFKFELNANNVAQVIENNDKRSLNKILQIISHELLHAIQFDRSKTNSNPVTKKHKKYKEHIQYYSSPEEIEAYAANAVQELEQDANIELKQVLKGLHSSSSYKQTQILNYISSQSEAFRTYYVIFGESNNDHQLNKIFKRFMKKFLYHINDRL